MPASARVLLNGIVDYAGTFPPSGLTLADALEQYLEVRAGAGGWLVGRFILPASLLHEFDSAFASRSASGGAPVRPPLHLSVVLGPRSEARVDDVLAFARRGGRLYEVHSLEFPPLPAPEIRSLASAVPQEVESFFEVPIDGDLERRIDAIEASGARAKVRTGGVTAGVFPNPADLVRFLEACNDTGVAFKATAGLHHCIRGAYVLTYEPGSATDTMHGFLNLGIAAAIVHAFSAPADAVEALVETSADAFRFEQDAVIWRHRSISTETLRATRLRFFRSFGSCSVREPIDELKHLELL